MPKRISPLAQASVQGAKPKSEPYKLRDGGGLYLLVQTDGSKLWRLDYRRPVTGKRNTLSLGAFPAVKLAQARKRQAEARDLLANGIDPGEQRKAVKAAGIERAANSFEAVAREWLAVKGHDWTPRQLEKETKRLEKHAFPWVGGKPIADLGVPEIRPLIDRVAKAGHLEQAHRLRFQLSRVFQYAVATQRVPRDPAADLKAVLPSRRKQRFPTITDPAKVGELLRAMEGFGGTLPVACALKLAPLWFCRPGEIRLAEWAHFDLEGPEPTYRVPPQNRKLRKADKEHPDAQPHVIPLSTQALEILRSLQPVTGRRQYVFPSARDPKRPMSDGAVNAALARIGFKDVMVGHGFRHMAATLLNELGWNKDAIERQLSHKEPGVAGVYNMAQHLAERRRMMQAWADYLVELRDRPSEGVFRR